MAIPDHLARLQNGVPSWNSWRGSKNTDLLVGLLGGWRGDSETELPADLIEAQDRRPDLSGVNLRKLNLRGVDFSGVDLSHASLSEADLSEANLSEANFFAATLSKTKLNRANLSGANLSEADLTEADLCEANLIDASLIGTRLLRACLSRACLIDADLLDANLIEADLSGADLNRANLSEADLSQTNLSQANLCEASLIKTVLTATNITGCRVYGLSAWDVQLEGAIQSDLIITPAGAPAITVDHLEVAQFIYLLLNNRKIRHVIDTITSKVVLILGRFTPERKAILDAIRDELRKRDYLPVLFDFDKPTNRDITETVSTLAHMAKFIIADITDARSIPQELSSVVRNLPSVPVQPLLLASQQEYGMFEHFRRFPWVLEPFLYEDQNGLLAALTEKVIGPAEAKSKEQIGR